MKLFPYISIVLTLVLSSFMHVNGKEVPTIKEHMQVIHEHYDVNFIYDSSIDMDIRSGARIDPKKMSLEECLEAIFRNTGLEYEIQRKYVVITYVDKKRKPKDYTILIEEQHDTLNESIITALLEKERNSTQTGFSKIDSKVFDRGFAVMSSPDVIKALQQLPGVSSGTELLSGMYVRGGDGADNLYLLDDVPLYQVSHLLGLFSSFNTDVTESVDFYKSGFPARYGGRLSSVVDVNTRPGDFNSYHGLFSIGLLDGRLQFEGPIIKEKTSFNIGLRRSWIDVLSEPACLIASGILERDLRLKYAFWDLNANVTHRFSKENTLSLNIYGGRDAFKIRQEEDSGSTGSAEDLQEFYYNEMGMGLVWGNFLASLGWDWKFADNHELEAKAYLSNYDSNFSFEEVLKEDMMEHINTTSRNGVNRSRTLDAGLKADFSFRPSETHHLRYGATMQYHRYSPEYLSELKVTNKGETLKDGKERESGRKHSLELAGYAEDEMRLANWLTANLGLRYSVISAEGRTYHSLQPRAALLFRCGDYTDLKLSYSEMVQNSHLIASNYLQLPTSFWMPSTAKIAPSHSRQVSGGAYFRLPHNIRFNAEGYFKTMDNILEFRGQWGIYPPIHLWEEAMVSGKGRSWGLESEFSWADGKTSVTAAYTLSWSQRFFEEFYPEWYRDRNDNRHKLTLTATRRFGKRFEMYASWNFNSGGWMTGESHAIPSDKVGERPEMFYEVPNNIKLPCYHRLDLGFNFRKTTRRGNESIWNLSIYNTYCNMNPIVAYMGEMYEFTKENMTGLTFVGEAFGIVPVIPSFSYTLKF